jgi:hypothetical protein
MQSLPQRLRRDPANIGGIGMIQTGDAHKQQYLS